MDLSKKDMAQSVFDAMNTRDFSIAPQIFSDDINFYFPGINKVEGIRKVVVVLGALLRKYSQLYFNVLDIILDGNKVCVVWENKGIHIDGQEYANSGVTLIYFENDKIISLSDYFKDTSFVK